MIKIEGYIPIDDKRAFFPFFSICKMPWGPKVKNWVSLIDTLNKLKSANDCPAISSIDNIVRTNIYSDIFLTVEFIDIKSNDSDLGVLQRNL